MVWKSKRYLYVLFTCQQSVEKMLKALIVKNTKSFPPKIHDLVKLLNLAEIDADKEEKEFLQNLIIITWKQGILENFQKSLNR